MTPDQRLGRRRRRQPAVPRRCRDRGRQDRRGRTPRRRCDGNARHRRDRQGRVPRLRRPAQPQRLLAAREPDRREHDPPGRDDRGRRQLRLELRADLRPLARVHERPAPHLRLRRPGDPVDDVRRAPRLPRGGRAQPQPGLVRRAQLDQARGRRLRLASDRAAVGADGPLHAGGDGGRRARHVDGARVQPGPRGDDGGARAPERDRRRVRRHLHEPRPQPRLGDPARDRRVPRGRPRRRDPRRDLPPQRAPQHECARPGLGARRRDDGGGARGGHGRARRHDAVRRRPRPALRDPAAVGRRRRQGAGARVPARSRDAQAPADGMRPLLAVHPQGRVGSRAPAGERAASRVGRPHVRPDRRPAQGRSVGLLLRRARRRRRQPTRASSSSAGSSPTSTWRR